MKFYICEAEPHQGPCVFSEQGWKRLPSDSSTGMSRCIHHGEIIDIIKDFPDRETARKWAKGESVNGW